MKDLKDKIILITGAGQGLGAATAEVLANAQTTIIGADIKDEQVKKMAQELTKKGKQADAVVMNVTDEKSVTEGIKQIIKKYGRIDVLINNAGLDVDPKPVEEYTPADFDKVLNVNLRGPFLLMRAVLPQMYQRNSGHIVNICSTASHRTWPNASLYHISKTALRGLSWSLFTEIREKKSDVRVSAIIPGGMKTAHNLDRFPDMDFSWMQDPKSVAETIKFVLLTPEKSVIPEITIIPPLEWSLP